MIGATRLVAVPLLYLAACVIPLPHEGTGSYARSVPTATFPVAFSGERLAAGSPTAGPSANEAPVHSSYASPRADDAARLVGTPQRTAYALVVGIERYRDLPAAAGAASDAERFSEMLRTTFGIPAAQIRVALNDRATRADLEEHLEWLEANVPSGGRVYFFFSGHGSPGVAEGKAHLVPYDARAETVERAGIPLSTALRALSNSRGREALAFIDACFSGTGGRSVLPKDARPLVPVQTMTADANVALFASASAQQIAGLSATGESGLFTKYLVEALSTTSADLDGDGQVTMSELVGWVTPRVTREARQLSREQTPSAVLGSDLGNGSNTAVVWGLK